MNENAVGQKKPQTMREWLDQNQARFLEAIPKGTIDVGRFITAASLEIANNPKLQKCDKLSIFQSLLESARYGLEVGRLLGQAWLIPYNEMKYLPDGSKAKVMTCHFQLGYKGLIVLARRSQTIKSIVAETVYEHDFFEVELGQGRHLTHRINIREERGEPIAYYCLVELENGGYQFGVMSKKDAEKHRDRYSKAHKQKFDEQESVWDTNFDEMAIKTVVIKTLKLCPISIEALEAAGKVEQEEEIRISTPPAEMLPPPPDNPIVEPVAEEEKKSPPETVSPAADAVQKTEQPVPSTEEPKEPQAEKKIGRPLSKTFEEALKATRQAARVAEYPARKPEPPTSSDTDSLGIF